VVRGGGRTKTIICTKKDTYLKAKNLSHKLEREKGERGYIENLWEQRKYPSCRPEEKKRTLKNGVEGSVSLNQLSCRGGMESRGLCLDGSQT